MDKDKLLKVSEVFYSIQGEGSTMGIPSVFVRLSDCNIVCGGKGTLKDQGLHDGATWRCDSIETWRKGKRLPHEEVIPERILDHLLRIDCHLIFTGGEPLLQQEAILNYLDWFYDQYDFSPPLEIETNGTIKPMNKLLRIVDYWNISPKLSNSGVSKENRIKPEVLKLFNNQQGSIFKFVITSEKELDEIILDFMVDYSRIWLMPGASNQEELQKVSELVSALALEHNLKFSTRLQIVLWNKTVGV